MNAYVFPNVGAACAYGDAVDAALGYPNPTTLTDTWGGSTAFPPPAGAIVVHHVDGRAAFPTGAPSPAPAPEAGTFEGPEDIDVLEWTGGPSLPGLP
jgi:hypothetical protein